MDADDDYAPDEVSDEEIDDIDAAIDEEFAPREAESEDDVVSDYADEDEPSSEEDADMDVDEPEVKKKRKKNTKNVNSDLWKASNMEEHAVKPYKMADKYIKARQTIDNLIQTELKLTQPLSPWHFASTDDYDRFVEDCEQYVHNLANKHMETETLNTIRRRLAKQKSSNIPQYSPQHHLSAARKQIAVSMASLQFKIDKRVKPLMNAAQPSGQGGREATLAAALLSRKQLQEAAKWIDDEDAAMDAEIAARKVKPEAASASKFKFNRPPPQSGDPNAQSSRPAVVFPPKPSSSAGKDESSLATGYNRKIVEMRGQRELFTDLGIEYIDTL